MTLASSVGRARVTAVPCAKAFRQSRAPGLRNFRGEVFPEFGRGDLTEQEFSLNRNPLILLPLLCSRSTTLCDSQSSVPFRQSLS